MTPARKLHAIERRLASISDQLHKLVRERTALQRTALEVRTSFSARDASEYEALRWTSAQGLERVGR